jgi:hypothetical protein
MAEVDPNAPTVKSLIHESDSWPLFRLRYEEWICYRDDDEGLFYGWCERAMKIQTDHQAQAFIADMAERDYYRNVRIETAEIVWTETDRVT